MKGKYQGQVRPKVGAPKLFSDQMEEDLALYMKHCQYLRIPHTKQMLKDEIVHFVQYKNLNISKLQDEGPGMISVTGHYVVSGNVWIHWGKGSEE